MPKLEDSKQKKFKRYRSFQQRIGCIVLVGIVAFIGIYVVPKIKIGPESNLLRDALILLLFFGSFVFVFRIYKKKREERLRRFQEAGFHHLKPPPQHLLKKLKDFEFAYLYSRHSTTFSFEESAVHLDFFQKGSSAYIFSVYLKKEGSHRLWIVALVRDWGPWHLKVDTYNMEQVGALGSTLIGLVDSTKDYTRLENFADESFSFSTRQTENKEMLPQLYQKHLADFVAEWKSQFTQFEYYDGILCLSVPENKQNEEDFIKLCQSTELK